MSVRIVKNSVLLYLRMAIVMIVNLFVVRYTLIGLGVEDYGIYNTVAGVVTMLSSISYVLSTATQRYYSFYYGKGDYQKVTEIFSVSVSIYFIFSIIIIIFGETLGLWFINNKLVIPDTRIYAANWIYQFSIFSFIFSIFNVPFSAAIIAHENMNVYAFLSVFDCFAKLGLVYFMKDMPFDKLIYYGAVLLIISVFNFIIYAIYSITKYSECHYIPIFDKQIYLKFLSFSGWSLFGSLAGVGMVQINTILTNIFFGPIVNAARAIAFQINSLIHTFANNIVLAVRTPMIKSYAEASFDKLYDLFNLSNKFILYTLLFIIIPLFYEMDTILEIWINSSDSQTITFCRLILIYSLFLALSTPITIMIQATGDIKKYHIYVEIPTLLCMPATYIAFKSGFAAESAFILMIVSIAFAHVIRLFCLRRSYPDFSIKTYVVDFCLKGMIVIGITCLVLWFVHTNLTNDIMRLLVMTIVNIFIICITAYAFALNTNEKVMVNNIVKRIIKRI